MELFTKTEIPVLKLRIDHTKCGLMLGSCFAASIAERLRGGKFAVETNPFGVLYNPASIGEAIGRLESGQAFVADDLCERNGLWFSFAHHGSFSSPDARQALESMNGALVRGHAALLESDYVVITLGTAWVYSLRETGTVVANCHKLPGSEFSRSRLSVSQIVAIFRPLLDGVLRSKRVLFTVSPIRHLKDGLQQNLLSKATLVLAAHELVQSHDNAEYFPSYEIMVDELRDYRFYKEDMTHPSDQAVDYIWSLFRGASIGKPTQELIDRISALNRAMNHRPFNPDTASHAKFKMSMLKSVERLIQENPTIDFNNELNFFKL